MASNGFRNSFANLFRSRLRKTIALCLFALLVFVIFLSILARHAEPLLRARIVETLSARFHGRAELEDLKVSVGDGLLITGTGLKIFGPNDPDIQREGMQPLIGVDEFRFHTGVMNLLRSPMHVGAVFMGGLELNIPPREDRARFQNVIPKGSKIKIVVDQFHAERAELVVNTASPDKMPLIFEIQDLHMKDIGGDAPLAFTATLINPKPVGNIASRGEFGPFRADDPRQSPVRGDYTFSHADLGTLKGIGGILSSTGRYEGTLGRIVVDGQTATPDFRINISGRPVPLKTTFHAVVDGTSGDTYLQPVHATILSTPLTATGSVVRATGANGGHDIQLDVDIPGGKIEDLLRLAVRTDPPVMTGRVRVHTKLDLPPGRIDISDKLHLKGTFEVTKVHFSNEKVQGKVDSISLRSQGKPKLATDGIPDNVRSQMTGSFVLKNSVLTVPDLRFQMPGTDVALAGTYSLDGNQFDFQGHARFDAKLSQMIGGWKSIFLKPIDPFFSKHGAGTELPISITGTKSEPHFGLGHKSKEPASTSQIEGSR